MKRNVSFLAAVVGLCLLVMFSAGCEKLKARDHLNKGVQAYKSARYPEAVEHFKIVSGSRSQLPDGPLVSGDRLHDAVHPGRGFSGEQPHGEGRRGSVSRGIESGPEEHRSPRLDRLVETEPEEVRRSRHLVQEADRGRPEQQRSLLQPRLYRLVEVVPGPDDGPSQTGHEAGRPRSDQGQEGRGQPAGRVLQRHRRRHQEPGEGA